MGELLIDFAPVSTNAAGYPTLAAQPGGAPGNFLVALQTYGCTTALIGKVGADRFGGLLKATLAEKGIETRGILADPAVFTTLAFVTLDATGNRAFSFARKSGAGDIFGGSAMSQFLKTGKAPDELSPEELRAITRFACCAASLSTQTHGGIDSVPEERLVHDMLRTRPPFAPM